MMPRSIASGTCKVYCLENSSPSCSALGTVAVRRRARPKVLISLHNGLLLAALCICMRSCWVVMPLLILTVVCAMLKLTCTVEARPTVGA